MSQPIKLSKETIRKLQLKELESLRVFKEFCQKNNLLFYFCGGCCIGTLRHQGFIPWDDDIDLCIPSKDYHTLISVFEEKYSDRYEIMNADKDPKYPLSTTRIMIKGTQFCEEALKDLPLNLGIFLDIYPLETVSENDQEFRKQARRAWFWSHLRMLKLVPRPFILNNGWKSRIIKAVTYTAGTIISLLPISLKTCISQENKAKSLHSHEEPKRFAFMCDTNPYKSVWSYDEIFPLKQLDFEGMKVNFPANLHEHLTQFYDGDYMQLPPVEQRKNHYPARLDFGRW